ncbi:hypothetical protein [Roseomonas sp. HF4]|uniref:hypothetical protein n=1 Tax=Roseomonas sp. HF4 TaxID=2562313 RepID=UPI0010C05716|nr:hypothetical protein [Roseomonas sp. HF4]
MKRRVALFASLLLLPGPLAAQSPPAGRRRHRNDPIPLPPPSPPDALTWAPAPVPDRDLEAPRGDRSREGAPRLDPALIDPNAPRVGTARDSSNPQDVEDRLLRQPAPGARLRVPFTY